MQNEPIEVTLKVTAVLEQLNIPYLIGGSLASILYGMVGTHNTGCRTSRTSWPFMT